MDRCNALSFRQRQASGASGDGGVGVGGGGGGGGGGGQAAAEGNEQSLGPISGVRPIFGLYGSLAMRFAAKRVTGNVI
jgi:hypothetical protein